MTVSAALVVVANSLRSAHEALADALRAAPQDDNIAHAEDQLRRARFAAAAAINIAARCPACYAAEAEASGPLAA
jgi:hypothetical protein